MCRADRIWNCTAGALNSNRDVYRKGNGDAAKITRGDIVSAQQGACIIVLLFCSEVLLNLYNI